MKQSVCKILVCVLLLGLTGCGSREPAVTQPSIAQTTSAPAETPGSDGSVYYGFYKTPEGFLDILEDGTFAVLDLDGVTVDSGSCQFFDGLTLLYRDGTRAFFVLDENGDLYGGEDCGTYFRLGEADGDAGLPNYDFGEADFTGYWAYDNGYILQISGGEWYLYDDGGRMFQRGTVQYEDAEAWLISEDGSSGGGYLCFDETGNLTDSGQVLTRMAGFPYGNSEEENVNSFLEGLWRYSDPSRSIHFDGTESYTWTFPTGTETGRYLFDGAFITFHSDAGGSTEASLGTDGFIYIEDDPIGYYYRTE